MSTYQAARKIEPLQFAQDLYERACDDLVRMVAQEKKWNVNELRDHLAFFRLRGLAIEEKGGALPERMTEAERHSWVSSAMEHYRAQVCELLQAILRRWQECGFGCEETWALAIERDVPMLCRHELFAGDVLLPAATFLAIHETLMHLADIAKIRPPESSVEELKRIAKGPVRPTFPHVPRRGRPSA